MKSIFIEKLSDSYSFKKDSIYIGKAKLNKEVVPEVSIEVPLKTINRHGLISGATGTGKTKSLQILAEKLSEKGVPSLVMDMKGDLSGIAKEGDAENKHIISRHELLETAYEASGFPTELLSISDEKGVKLKATVSEFGPVLFSKILRLTETQEGIMAIIFKFCDDKRLPLVDLKDLLKVIEYITSDYGKEELKGVYGYISTRSLGSMVRKIVALQQQGGDLFFGEPSFDVEDLLHKKDGKGVINILRLTDIQSKPELFSTFMLSLLSEVYETFPEKGDDDTPKLALFIDEAHLMFQNATDELLQKIETVVKLIRSKGVGLFFCTQLPSDIPEVVLSQLGLKVQHALRGFTAKDRKNIKKAVENYPITEFYETDQLITELGIGEAFVTVLNEKGIPTQLAHTYLVAPSSRMDVLTEKEMDEIVENSSLVKEYNVEIDKESAYEILTEKLEIKDKEEKSKPKSRRGRPKKEESTFDKILKSSVLRSIGVAVAGIVTRGILGSLGVKNKRRYR